MTPPRVRVLVVDDSAFARKVLRELLTAEPRIEVVGIARDGLEALEKINELRPDVVTLDLVMPNLDGVGVLRAMSEPKPRVVVVSMSDAESELGLLAFEAGAVELVHKPTALATTRLYELGGEIIAKVLLVAGAKVPATLVPPARAKVAARDLPLRSELLVIGTSTGGPQALTLLLSSLPEDFPLPVAIALHIPAGYTEPMARRLNDACAIEVREASDGAELRPGMALLARGGDHLEVERGRVRVGGSVGDEPHTPSVDVLFRSAARAYGRTALGLVMTGMGSDGLDGSRAIVRAGGRVLTESKESCIVFGMPRCVEEEGLSAAQAPLPGLAGLVLRLM